MEQSSRSSGPCVGPGKAGAWRSLVAHFTGEANFALPLVAKLSKALADPWNRCAEHQRGPVVVDRPRLIAESFQRQGAIGIGVAVVRLQRDGIIECGERRCISFRAQEPLTPLEIGDRQLPGSLNPIIERPNRFVVKAKPGEDDPPIVVYGADKIGVQGFDLVQVAKGALVVLACDVGEGTVVVEFGVVRLLAQRVPIFDNGSRVFSGLCVNESAPGIGRR